MTIETKVSINFTAHERAVLHAAAELLMDLAWKTEEISDEISEKSTKASEFLDGLIGLKE